MPLQIRRGTAAERNAISSPLAIGELLYVTDQGKIYIGDGTALGGDDSAGNPGQGGKGLIVTGFTSEEARDAAAEMFIRGEHNNIFFFYNDTQDTMSATVSLENYEGNVSINGTLSISEEFQASSIKASIFADDSTLLVDAVSGTIPYSVISGAPTALSSFTNDTGFVTLAQINEGNFGFVGDLQGSVFGADSTMLVDALNSKIVAPIEINFNEIFHSISDTGLNIRSNPSDRNIYVYSYGDDGSGTSAGNIYVKDDAVEIYTNWQNGGVGENKWLFNDSGELTLPGTIRFDDGSVQSTAWTGSLAGGILTNDVRGSIFADDSTMLVDGVNAILTGDLYGTVRGNISSFSDQNTVQQLILSQADNSNLSNVMTFSKARGTIDSLLAVQNNDTLYEMQWVGHDGTDFQRCVTIRGGVGGPVSSGVVPGKLDVLISNNSGTLTNVMNISSEGLFNISGLGLLINSDSEDDSPIVCRAHFDTTTDAPNLLLQRSRGTSSSPAALQLNDKIFDLAWGGYSPNGTYNVSARIRSTVYATPSGNTVPGQLEFATRISSGGLQTKVTIDEHKTTFSTMPVLPTYAGDIAATAACGGTAVNGMMYYDSNTSTVRAYLNGFWQSL